MKRRYSLLVVFAAQTACVASSDSVTEAPATVAQAATTIQSPTLEGELSLGETSNAVFSNTDRYHAWDFQVYERSAARFYTLPLGNDGVAVDTRLYLYKERPSGWATYIAKNDDAHDTVWSEISYTLDPGSYRLVVIAKSANTPAGYRVGYDCPTCLGQDQCVFGKTFHQVRTGLTVNLVRERTIDNAAQLSDLEKAQLVEAMKASTHDDVTTADEAIERVDGNEVNLLHLYAPTTGKAYLAFEYGAGDNSFGKIYESDSVNAVATIEDGDLVQCTVKRGGVGSDCNDSNPCPGELRCTGIVESINKGACFDPQIGQSYLGFTCTAENHCADDQYCSLITHGTEGICAPAWMRKSFDSWQGRSIPDGRPAGVSATIQAYGLATVDTDVQLRATIRHAATEQLQVTLTNPGGTERTVYDGVTKGRDLHINQVVGFSGDESVNGAWTLKVVDKKRGTSGTIERWGLTISSRWD